MIKIIYIPAENNKIHLYYRVENIYKHANKLSILSVSIKNFDVGKKIIFNKHLNNKNYTSYNSNTHLFIQTFEEGLILNNVLKSFS